MFYSQTLQFFPTYTIHSLKQPDVFDQGFNLLI
jgi:hypothetical protein